LVYRLITERNRSLGGFFFALRIGADWLALPVRAAVVTYPLLLLAIGIESAQPAHVTASTV